MGKLNLRYRKCSDIGREYAVFELVDKDDIILLDVGYSDERELEVTFHQGISNRQLPGALLLDLLAEGKELAGSELD